TCGASSRLAPFVHILPNTPSCGRGSPYPPPHPACHTPATAWVLRSENPAPGQESIILTASLFAAYLSTKNFAPQKVQSNHGVLHVWVRAPRPIRPRMKHCPTQWSTCVHSGTKTTTPRQRGGLNSPPVFS